METTTRPTKQASREELIEKLIEKINAEGNSYEFTEDGKLY